MQIAGSTDWPPSLNATFTTLELVDEVEELDTDVTEEDGKLVVDEVVKIDDDEVDDVVDALVEASS